MDDLRLLPIISDSQWLWKSTRTGISKKQGYREGVDCAGALRCRCRMFRDLLRQLATGSPSEGEKFQTRRSLAGKKLFDQSY